MGLRNPVSVALSPPTTARPGSIPLSSLTSSSFRADEGELDEMMERRAALAASTRRSASMTLLHILAIVAIVAASLIPPVARALRLDPRDTLMLLAPVALASIAATSVHRLAGASTAQYRLIDAIEALLTSAASLTLVFRSRGVESVLWVPYFAQLFFAARVGARRRLYFAVLTLPVMSVALAFWLRRNDGASALATLALGALALTTYATLTRAVRALAEAEIGWERVQERFVDRRVESERGRLARDLHDGVGAELSALVWQARLLREELDDESAHADVDRFIERVQLGAEELRAVVWALRSGEQSWRELTDYAQARCRELVGASITLEFKREGDDSSRPLPGRLRTELLRLVQEGVRNAVRHATPTKISVTMALQLDTQTIALTVEDDGSGLPEGALETSRGGLRNAQLRAQRLRGTATFVSSATGTRVDIRVPWSGEA